MSDNSQNDTSGQSGIDQETERRNRENETGQQSQEQSQSGQQPESGQQSESQATDQTQPEQSEGETGFVGSGGDQSSDYLTKGENQDFQPEGQGATDTDAGTSDITTGQPTSSDSTLDDGSDTSR